MSHIYNWILYDPTSKQGRTDKTSLYSRYAPKISWSKHINGRDSEFVILCTLIK